MYTCEYQIHHKSRRPRHGSCRRGFRTGLWPTSRSLCTPTHPHTHKCPRTIAYTHARLHISIVSLSHTHRYFCSLCMHTRTPHVRNTCLNVMCLCIHCLVPCKPHRHRDTHKHTHIYTYTCVRIHTHIHILVHTCIYTHSFAMSDS